MNNTLYLNAHNLLDNLAFAQPNESIIRESSQEIETLMYEASFGMEDYGYLADLNGNAEHRPY
jgi:hypothetical protein